MAYGLVCDVERAARFFGPQVAGNRRHAGGEQSVRIDHDEHFNQTLTCNTAV